MDGEREKIEGEQEKSADLAAQADAPTRAKTPRKPAKAKPRRGEDERVRKAKRPAAKRPSGNARGAKHKGRAQDLPGFKRGAFKNLTPDRLRAIWELHHPEHPEIRATLERIYRLS